MKVYSLGYKNIKISDFKKFLNEDDSIAIDVRYNPNSFSIFWSKKYLESHIKNYIHIKKLGNTSYKSSKISILDLKSGLEIFFNKVKNFNKVVIFCSCSNFNTCHRKIIVDELEKKYDINVEELFVN